MYTKNQQYPPIPIDINKLALWNEFCFAHHIDEIGVPLFEMQGDDTVKTFRYGLDQRLLLQRSQAMEVLLVEQVEKVIEDSTSLMQGILYIALLFRLWNF